MHRAGEYVNNLSGNLAYRSFRPSPLPPDPPLTLSDALTEQLLGAHRSLAQLETASVLIPDADLFVTMYVRKEALLSSIIEGTQCTLEDVLDPTVDTNRNLDVSDVVNYVRAAEFALDRRQTLPICNRLLRETHAQLLSGVRGEEKNPGEFRRSQNWIGAAGCSLSDARFVPPNPSDMDAAMVDLEKYINESEDYDVLIRAALIHYQFETIHPFLDGNGRIGRLLILLYLIEKGVLSKPVLYISYFLKKNQTEYYDRMGEVRRRGDYEQWIAFFLEAVRAAADDALQSIEQLEKLHRANLERLPKPSRSVDRLRTLFSYLESHPIVDIRHTALDLGISFNTAASAVKKLVELGILRETTNTSRNRVFAYEDYLAILREGT